MTRAIFETEKKDDLKLFVALARKQGISVKYLRVSLDANTIKSLALKNATKNQRRYNKETLAAIQEAKDIMSGKIKTKRYKTVEEMNADIDSETDLINA